MSDISPNLQEKITRKPETSLETARTQDLTDAGKRKSRQLADVPILSDLTNPGPVG
jgi:hypothetical protein